MSAKTPADGQSYDQWLRQDDVDAVAAMCRFFMEDDPVHHTLRKVASKLEELGIPYAIAGGMALGAHRFVRATTSIDVGNFGRTVNCAAICLRISSTEGAYGAKR